MRPGVHFGGGLDAQPEIKASGGHSGGDTPVPIPNTEVKPTCADGTWGVVPWESRSPPDFDRTGPAAEWRGARFAFSGRVRTQIIGGSPLVLSALWLTMKSSGQNDPQAAQRPEAAPPVGGRCCPGTVAPVRLVALAAAGLPAMARHGSWVVVM